MADNKTDGSYERRRVAKGRRIFNEGEAGDYAYIVEMGEVGIYKKIEGSEVEITTLNPGEIFGEIAVLAGRERLASAIALTDSSLIVVSPETLEQRIKGADKFVKTLLSIFMTNLRDTHDTYKNPSHNFDGHLKSIVRHSHAMGDLALLTHIDGFNEEAAPLLVNIRDNCDKLYEISKKYNGKAKG
ncbi:cyclic nucleotide-binding domain-containing protein [Terasakiella sp. A23]|uniref:cyclic nucleotide-binding domain-containing protein n=1 Tax=Terasakiella sp. FCG-A23 TaxID=3080561 RepID=UPI0029534A2F|nr:cyclic nucleotide-binding domain-containing protein [Terasakiella sp. A23]MDV7339208.1 cyclic nucleotide-binding domain-containing protein [Terasakiella sp. A23]